MDDTSWDLFSSAAAAQSEHHGRGLTSDHGAAQAIMDAEADAEAKIEAQRMRLLARIRGHQLDSLETRVAFVLSEYPETRNSDITLQLQYWQVFQRSLVSGGVIDLDALYQLDRLTDLTRARQKIQNTLRLFQATDDRVAEQRRQLSESYRRHHTLAADPSPSVFVYGDESGKNDDHLVVGSVWVLAPGEFYRFLGEATEWREQKGITYELHSTDLGPKRLDAYREFIERFVIGEGILGFKAVSMPRAGISDREAAFGDLYYLLLLRGIEHEHESGRARLPRSLTFIKDYEEQGSDSRVLATIDTRLARDVQTVFKGQLSYDLEEPVSSKGEIMLQVADLFTWCVNRRLNVIPSRAGSMSWRDEFAEWFLDQIGFEMDTKATLGDRAVHLSLLSPSLKHSNDIIMRVPEDELARGGTGRRIRKRNREGVREHADPAASNGPEHRREIGE